MLQAEPEQWLQEVLQPGGCLGAGRLAQQLGLSLPPLQAQVPQPVELPAACGQWERCAWNGPGRMASGGCAWICSGRACAGCGRSPGMRV